MSANQTDFRFGSELDAIALHLLFSALVLKVNLLSSISPRKKIFKHAQHCMVGVGWYLYY